MSPQDPFIRLPEINPSLPYRDLPMMARRPATLPGGRSARRGVRGWAALVLCLALAGCAGGQVAPEQPDATLASGTPASLAAEVGTAEPASTARSPAADQAARQHFSRERRELRAQVAAACRQGGESGDPARLRLLVDALYASGVDPGAATEALRQAGCASPAEIAFEMVGQGGEASLPAVAGQFQGVRDPAARKRIASALADGLARYAGETAARAGEEVPEPTPTYGMLYLPAVGDSARWDSSIALNRLYEDAIPGYGIYTFVILGRGSADDSGEEATRYRELFRVLETYVTGAEQEFGQPSPASHVFLIPIKLGEMDAPLLDQVARDLSDHMRLVLTRDLRHAGYARLAARLERGAGPFLVSTLEPHLLPAHGSAPRLVTDLSAIGPEYIYGVVDAYDRAVPAGAEGQARQLKVLLERLREMPVAPAEPTPAQTPAPEGGRKERHDWLFPLGRFAAVMEDRPSLDTRAPAAGAREPTPAGGSSSDT